jgi:C-methyltransferase
METKQEGLTAGPAMIMQLMGGAQASATVCGAVELGLFKALGEGPLDAASVAKAVGCPERTTRMMLGALCALGLLAHDGTRYRLQPAAEAHLVPGRPAYVGDFAGIAGSDLMWNALGHLADAVRKGGSVLEGHAETPQNKFWETFARSSASMAVPAAAAIEGMLAPWLASKRARVLDIAAGSGIYGYTLAKAHSNVELTALDWPNVLPETRSYAPRFGVEASRVRYLPGNLFEVDFQGPYEVILASHIFHHFDPPTCQKLMRKIAGQLAPGGRVVIHEFLGDENNPSGALFAITMLVWSQKGDAYASADYRKWLAECELRNVSVAQLPGMPTAIVMAERA